MRAAPDEQEERLARQPLGRVVVDERRALVRGHYRTSRRGKRYRVRSYSRAHVINLPQRQFIGESRFLNRRLQAQLRYRLTQAIR